MERLLQWRPKTWRDWTMISAGVVLVAAILIAVDAYLFNWNYSGFGPKTFWDWMDLLIVPLVLAVGGFIYNRTEKQAERDQSEKRNQTEREIADDNQREAVLQTYLDRMSDLLLGEQGLRDSRPDDEIRSVARSRTVTVLRQLDPMRQGSVLQFLHESDLIAGTNPIVELEGANLAGANLTGAFLMEGNLVLANLAGANFTGAILLDTNFSGANLEGADLTDADLTRADLEGADLTDADLTRADLTDADLSLADLQGAKGLTVEQIKAAKNWEQAFYDESFHAQLGLPPITNHTPQP